VSRTERESRERRDSECKGAISNRYMSSAFRSGSTNSPKSPVPRKSSILSHPLSSLGKDEFPIPPESRRLESILIGISPVHHTERHPVRTSTSSSMSLAKPQETALADSKSTHSDTGVTGLSAGSPARPLTSHLPKKAATSLAGPFLPNDDSVLHLRGI